MPTVRLELLTAAAEDGWHLLSVLRAMQPLPIRRVGIQAPISHGLAADLRPIDEPVARNRHPQKDA